MVKKWVPLESNPDVLNDFTKKLGLDVDKHCFHDVLGLDEELLMMVPQPVLAVILCYPVTAESDRVNKEEDEKIAERGQHVAQEVYYMKQTIGNACGTIAVLHGIGNNMQTLAIEPGSYLQTFFETTSSMDPAARGRYLEEPPEGAPDIEEAHQAAAAEGNTAPPAAEDDVDLHFVCYVHVAGNLYELDGRRKSAVNHGPTSADTLLKDTVPVVQSMMKRTQSLNFNIMVLAAGA